MSLRSLRSRVARLAQAEPTRPLPVIDWDNLTCPLEDIRPDASGIDWRAARTHRPVVITDPLEPLLAELAERTGIPVASDADIEAYDARLRTELGGAVAQSESAPPSPPEETEIVPPSASEVGFPVGYAPEPEPDDYEPDDDPQQETDDAD